ncbi:MAG TPA: hypothetical protein VFP88_07730, partial [Rhodanobacteraceae bacterium]|nr:hypothetical protein [Rhodanobacteraceae bacterium]
LEQRLTEADQVAFAILEPRGQLALSTFAWVNPAISAIPSTVFKPGRSYVSNTTPRARKTFTLLEGR